MWRRPIAIGWIDFLVVSAASLAFTATLLSHPQRHWGPSTEEQIEVQRLAGELGVTQTYAASAADEGRVTLSGLLGVGPVREAIEGYGPPPLPPPMRF